MKASDHISDLAARGRYHFTTNEIMAAMGSSGTAARAALRRLRGKGIIAMPYRGFNVYVPPEYRPLGCLPAEQFIPQLMAHLGQTYYAALLSAAQLHGAAHQQPQVFQIMGARNRPRISCGKVRVDFAARHNVAAIPTTRMKTPRGWIDVSSPEATAFDLVGYREHTGGFDNVATILTELREIMDAVQLAAVAQMSPTPWAQRLGYLLDLTGPLKDTEPLAAYVTRNARETALLIPGIGADEAKRDTRWKLAVNTAVEPEL
jgi:predicted transcriptional regulator of viral defense system